MFQLERKKDGRNGVKGDDASGSGHLLPSGTESLHGYRPVMEPSGRNSNDEHCTMTSGGALGGGAHFMMQPPQGMHMTHARPSEWGGAGYDLSGNFFLFHLIPLGLSKYLAHKDLSYGCAGMRGNGSSENGEYE